MPTRPYFRVSKNAIAILVLIFGGIFFLAGVGFLLEGIVFKSRALSAEGVITGFKEREGDSVTYSPVFEFSDASNNIHRVASDSSSNPPMGKVGDRVKVLYEPQSPDNARIDDAFFLFISPALFLFVGIGTLVGGLLILRSYRKGMAESGGYFP
jgi:hypothetical protein